LDLRGRGVGVDPDQQILDNGACEKDGDDRRRSIRRRCQQEPGGRREARGGMGVRILIDGTAAVSGGGVYLDSLIDSLVEEGTAKELLILHVDRPPGTRRDSPRTQIRYHAVRIPSFLALPGIPPGVWRTLWRRWALPRWLERWRPDLFFSNSGEVPAQPNRSWRTVMAVHNSMPLRAELIREEPLVPLRLRLLALRRSLHRSLQQSDRAIVFSEDTAQLIRTVFPDVQTELTVIPHGIDWEPAPAGCGKEDPGAEGPPYLLCVSHFHRYKNLVRLIEAFATVAAVDPIVQLLLVGELVDKAYVGEVLQAIERHGLSDRVRILPGCPREELKSIYRRARLFVMPSLAETCSYPLLEAMALGLPIVAARISALPEIAGEAALYFQPEDPDDLARAILAVLGDEMQAQRLSEAALHRSAPFTLDRAMRQTREVFAEVVAQAS
jgi:glycosyltransferase involved in cell wall biosynthesis